MEIIAKRDRYQAFIADYREKIAFYRRRIDWCNNILGRIEQRLGDQEWEEPRWS